jgi:hypothetical protein
MLLGGLLQRCSGVVRRLNSRREFRFYLGKLTVGPIHEEGVEQNIVSTSGIEFVPAVACTLKRFLR